MLVKGLNEDKVKQISKAKNEDEKTLKFRLDCYKKFKELKLPSFGPSIHLDFDKIVYYNLIGGIVWNKKLFILKSL